MMKKTSITTFYVFAASCALSNAALIHHWKMDETSGGTALDSAGSNNGTWQDGTSTNLAWVSGKIGNAADLQEGGGGESQHFSVGTLSSLAGSTAISISLWLNDDGETNYNGLFASRNDGSAGSWALALEGGNKIDFHTSGNTNQLDSGTPIADSTWYHVLATWNNATGVRNIFVNGDPAGTGLSTTDTFTGGINFVGNGTWVIGSDLCCSDDRDFNGRIDDLAVWDNALTAADALAIYNGGNLGIDAPTSLIPEPSAAILALLGGLMAFRRRR